MKKKHEFAYCDICNCKNDITQAIDNSDFDTDERNDNVGYIYCQQCGQQIQILLK